MRHNLSKYNRAVKRGSQRRENLFPFSLDSSLVRLLTLFDAYYIHIHIKEYACTHIQWNPLLWLKCCAVRRYRQATTQATPFRVVQRITLSAADCATLYYSKKYGSISPASCLLG